MKRKMTADTKRAVAALMGLALLGGLAIGFGLSSYTSSTIELYEGRRPHFGVDVLVSSTFSEKEILIRDAVAVKLYEEGYEECIRVYVNPWGDKKEVALARCGSNMGFRVVMRTKMVEAGWTGREPRNHFKIDFGERPHHVEPEAK